MLVNYRSSTTMVNQTKGNHFRICVKVIVELHDAELSTQECNFTSTSLIWQVTLVEFKKPVPCTATFLHGRFRLSHNPLL